MLAPLPLGIGGYVTCWVFGTAAWTEPALPACPVNNNRPNAPTSKTPFVPGTVAALCSGSATPFSRSLSVFWKGLFGGRSVGIDWSSSPLWNESVEPVDEA
jgi:hypothetical protein